MVELDVRGVHGSGLAGFLRLLHISDLHLAASLAQGQELLVSAMLRDVATLSRGSPIDVVVFTGDLAATGKAEEFAAARSVLLGPLLEVLNLPPDRFVLVPGNHDLDRDKIDEFLEPGLGQMANTETVDRLVNAPQFGQATARLDTWRDFYDDFYGKAHDASRPLGNVHRFTINGTVIGIAALNSAWRATGAPNDEDKGRLLLGETQARAALDEIGDCDVRLVAFHHPLEWQTPWSHEALRAELERRGTIVLTGHEHVANPTLEKTVRGAAIYLRAGCLYQGREYPNSYSIVDVDTKNRQVTVNLRSWFPSRGDFDAAVDRVESGRFRMSLPAQRGQDLLPALTYTAITSTLASMAHSRSLLAESLAGGVPMSIDEVIVEPRFYPAPFRQVAAAVTLARSRSDRKARLKRINLLALLDSHRVVIVNGDPEAGVTFSLYWALHQQFERDITRTPVYLQYEVKPGKDPHNTLIRQAARQMGLGISPKDARPPLVIAIDDIHEGSPQGLKRLCSHIAAHADDLYILACHGDSHRALRAALAEEGVDCAVAFLGPFGRQQTRALVNLVGANGVLENVDRVLELVFLESLPRSPFVLAALIAVLAAHPESRPPNVSSLLDAMIDLLLGKTDPQDVEAGLDFRRREHLLEFFAARLVSDSKMSLPRADTERLFDSYFEDRGFERSISAGNVVNSLLSRRILTESPHGVAFHHASLHHVLAAKFMLEDDAFGSQMQAFPMKHSEIIRHAASLRRSDRKLLERVSSATEPVLTEMIENIARMFDAMESTSPAAIDVDALETELRSSTPRPKEQIEQEKDDLHEDRELTYSAEPELQFPETTIEMMHATVFLSMVLAGSELVDDVELKTSLLKRAIMAWGSLADELGKRSTSWAELRSYFDGMFEAENDERQEAIWKQFVHISSVFAAGSMMSTIMNSQGLGAALRRLAQDAQITSSATNALYVMMLFVQMKLDGYVEQIILTSKLHPRHPVVFDLTRMQAIRICLDPATPHSDANRLMSFVADISVQASSGPSVVVQRSADRSRLIAALRTARDRHRLDPMGSNLVEDILEIEELPTPLDEEEGVLADNAHQLPGDP